MLYLVSQHYRYGQYNIPGFNNKNLTCSTKVSLASRYRYLYSIQWYRADHTTFSPACDSWHASFLNLAMNTNTRNAELQHDICASVIDFCISAMFLISPVHKRRVYHSIQGWSGPSEQFCFTWKWIGEILMYRFASTMYIRALTKSNFLSSQIFQYLSIG